MNDPEEEKLMKMLFATSSDYVMAKDNPEFAAVNPNCEEDWRKAVWALEKFYLENEGE